MKNNVVLLGIFLFLFGCSQKNQKSESAEITVTDSLITLDNNNTEERILTYSLEINKVLADTTIDNYYKEIYKQGKLINADDEVLLSIADSLFINNSDKDLFYFIVFTKSMNGSDGFFSEAISDAALKFITTRTEQFADYFNIAPKLTKADLDNWASFIYGEIQISKEGEEKKAIKELESLLFKNIEGSRKEYEFIVNSLLEKVKGKMP